MVKRKRSNRRALRAEASAPAERRTHAKPAGPARVRRRYPIGAEPVSGGVHFRVWAPKCKHIEVLLTAGPGAQSSFHLRREAAGYFSGLSRNAGAGTRYRFRPDGRKGTGFPDPASRFQPDGPHGDSEVIDSRFPWTDRRWKGVQLKEQVLYEMHIGTFT